MHNVLATHQGELIGINYDDPTKSRTAVLNTVADGYITVTGRQEGQRHHFPMTVVLSAIETQEGRAFKIDRQEVALVVVVFHNVVYKGAVGIGIGF